MKEYNLNWLDKPEVFAVNRCDAVSNHKFYSSVSNYNKKLKTDLFMDLNGNWKFDIVENLSELNTIKYLDNELDLGAFSNIKVPGHIQLQGFDRMHYTNTIYPWDGHEDLEAPMVPQDYNPVGIYIKDIELSKKQTSLPVYMQFNGVEVAFYLFVNGHFVGYAEDSFTPSRFDISKYVNEGSNRIVVQVHKFSTAAWLEDQDFWRFSGIFRDVFIYNTPEFHLEDLYVYSDFSNNYQTINVNVEAKFVGEVDNKVMNIKLIDQDTKEIVYSKENLLIEENLKLDFELEGLKLWSSEFPNLYELYIEVSDGDKVLEVISQVVGFREFKMDNGIMKINGKRIVFKGVNRHEFNHREGRVVSEEDMLWDIKFLKANNFNSVRSSHYPNVERWYELCDEYGIYVIDEANLETHGTWQKHDRIVPEHNLPGNLPEWEKTVVDRGQSMLERHKNFASIVIWSVGNESFAGTNILAMADYFRKKDPRRLVHYEGVFRNRDYNQISDMESRMYAKVDEIKEYLNTNPEKPFINCEYAHAMGNSCGNLVHYSDLEDKYEMYQGGFIWDYIDQGLEISRDGKHYIGYGGDFDDRPTDYNFCINGIVYANRVASPKMQEVKKAFEFVKLTPNNNGVLIKNRNLFDDLSRNKLVLKVLKEGKLISSETLSIVVNPGEDFNLNYDWPTIKTDKEVVLEAELLLGYNTKWANEDHVLSWGQNVSKNYKYILDSSKKQYNLVDGDVNIGIKTDSLKLMFHRTRGLVSLRVKGNELVKSDFVRPVFHRPSIDNDRGNNYNHSTSDWIGASLFSKVTNCVLVENENSVKIVYTYSVFENTDTAVELTYEVINDGLNIHYKYIPGTASGELTMHGIMFKLPREYEFVQYYGLGPVENYIDRNDGAKIGLFEFDVKDNLSAYTIPQESGNRSGTRHLTLKQRHNQQADFTVSSLGKNFEFNALPYSFLEIEQARHQFELSNSQYTHLTVSGIQRGVGGDDSWGAPTLEEYRIDAKEGYEFEIRIESK